jgi:HD superfamily phosphodiesterase
VKRDGWAEEYATHLLEGDRRRMAHTRAVARCATSLGGTLVTEPEDRTTLIEAAWLHDIGYAPRLALTGAHHLDGARHVAELGEERLACLVAHHSSGKAEAALRGFADDLAEFPQETSLVADILTYCDLSSGPDGAHVDLAKRLSEARTRYGDDHVVVRGLDASSELIEGAFARVDAALKATTA